MRADHIIEDLTNCKQQASTGEIHCCIVSRRLFRVQHGVLTHWPELAQDPEH
jgi:hypothetical protein